MAPNTIADRILDTYGVPFDGLTISGGEPFDQPADLLLLLQAVAQDRTARTGQFDVLVFSGYPEQRIKRDYAAHLKFIDLLISEPYVHKLESATLRGSENQKLLKLSPLAHERYSDSYLERIGRKPGIQVMSDKESLVMVGIPRRGDLDRIQTLARERGLLLDGSSWA